MASLNMDELQSNRDREIELTELAQALEELRSRHEQVERDRRRYEECYEELERLEPDLESRLSGWQKSIELFRQVVRSDLDLDLELDKLARILEDLRSRDSPASNDEEFTAQQQRLLEQLLTLEYNLESRLWSWSWNGRGLGELLFWQTVRLGGLGFVGGWLLHSCAAAGS